MKKSVIEDEMKFFLGILEQCTDDKRDKEAEYVKRTNGVKIYKFDDFYVMQGRGYEGETSISIQYTDKPFALDNPHIKFGYKIEDPTDLKYFSIEYVINAENRFHFNAIDGVVPNKINSEQILDFFEKNPDANIIQCVEGIAEKTILYGHIKTVEKLADLISLKNRVQPMKIEEKGEFIKRFLVNRFNRDYNYSKTIEVFEEKLQSLSEENVKIELEKLLREIESENEKLKETIEEKTNEDEKGYIEEVNYKFKSIDAVFAVNHEIQSKIKRWIDIYKEATKPKEEVEQSKVEEIKPEEHDIDLKTEIAEVDKKEGITEGELNNIKTKGFGNFIKKFLNKGKENGEIEEKND